jgi:DNA-binding NarL/FixJ family response regulator
VAGGRHLPHPHARLRRGAHLPEPGEYRRLAADAGQTGVATGARSAAGASSGLPTPRLTERETEVLRLVAKGMTYPEIAGLLVLSPRTVQNHVQNTLIKLQLHNKAQLVRYALEQGIG